MSRARFLPSQQQILQHWEAQPVEISICCITYNHQDFIADAIEGFLQQVCSVPFEIIIHDDASTDQTARIIESYQQRYPDLIFPILQTENQHALGKKSTLHCFARARGRYIALCEGDDYWLSPDKLNLQYVALQRHPLSQLCFHAARQITHGSEQVSLVAHHRTLEHVFSASEMIAGNGDFCPTASMLFEKKVVDTLPAWFEQAPVGDYFYQMLASLQGGAVFLPEAMSVYRAQVPGSWSARAQQLEPRLKHYQGVHKALQALDQDTKGVYHSLFQRIQASDFLNLARLAIKLDDCEEARALLRQSWRMQAGINLEQRVFYWVCRSDRMLKICYGLRMWLRTVVK